MSDPPFEQMEPSQSASMFSLLPRPRFHLRSLPVRYRWEATRRHPYYLTYWTSALRLHQNAPIERHDEPSLRQAAVAILEAIGVGGPPIPPETDFAAIDTEWLKRAGMAGLVHPVSNRGLLELLITALPKETLSELGAFLLNRFAIDGDTDELKLDALVRLKERGDAGLDEFVDEFFVSIAPTASRRAIETDLTVQLDRWRQQHGVSEQRDRSDKYAEYLEVWDQREGWSAGRYDNSQETLLREIARRSGDSLSTVNNRYRSAFELITGHPYSPALWLRVFGPDKLSALLAATVGRVTRRRPLRSPIRRDVPQTVVTPVSVSNAFLNSQPSAAENLDATDLKMDLITLMKEGLTDQQIADRFELGGKHVESIRAVRERFEEQ